MFLFQQKNYYLIILGLALMLVIPCSVKQEIKHQYSTENQQRTSNNKTSCQNVRDFERSYKTFVAKITLDSSKNDSIKIFSLERKKELSALGVFNAQKERIPTYILHQSFLI